MKLMNFPSSASGDPKLIIQCSDCGEYREASQSSDFLMTSFTNFTVPFGNHEKDQILFFLEEIKVKHILLIADLNCRHTDFLIEGLLSASAPCNQESGSHKTASIYNQRKLNYLQKQLNKRVDEIFQMIQGNKLLTNIKLDAGILDIRKKHFLSLQGNLIRNYSLN